MILSSHVTPKLKSKPKPKPTRTSVIPNATASPIRIWKFVCEFQLRRSFQKDRRALGKWMKHELIELGPAFIKMGQFLSTRQDAFEKDILQEIRGLQDDITPIPFEPIQHTIEQELKRPFHEVFTNFQPIPFATASIGQVHLAKLKKTGETVCVKVQKPFVADQIRTDIVTLQGINKFLTRIGFQRASEFSNIVDQYEQFLSGELNYLQECDNMIKFRKSVVGLNVCIPRTYKDYSTPKVLTMEYVPSTKITDIHYIRANNLDAEWIVDNLIYVFLFTVSKTGLIHCDPHPGNIGIKDNGDTLVLYDFGNMIQLSPSFLKQINNLIIAVYQKDVDEFLDLLVKLNIVQVKDASEINELKDFFVYFFDYLESLDFSQLKTSILDNDVLRETQISLKIDNTFLSLFRVFSLLDGTCSLLNPNFNYIDALQPFTQDIFSDMEFLDYRMRKDVQKISAISPTLRSTEQNVGKVNKMVTKMTQQATQTRILIGLLAILQCAHNPTDAINVWILPVVFGVLLLDETKK
jgi:predicted unusual protein kinase regulating ubiquinone biosynthesis (AarF/ABC1/UbiB family)